MKKSKSFQTGFLVFVALVVGFIVGVFVEFPPSDKKDVVGAVGKVDRYRNVQVTEDDILLRNELVEDSLKKSQLESYLNYYYYQSMRTSSDVKRVLKLIGGLEEFKNENLSLVEDLERYRKYLEIARTDLLSAFTMIKSLDDNESVPVITYVNRAQNAIARIRSNEDLLLDFMFALKNFMMTNPGVAEAELEDAYDVLNLNLLQSSIVTQNKPMLTFLVEKDLLNDKKGLKDLLSDAFFDEFVQVQVVLDMEKVGDVFGDKEKIGGFVLTGGPALAGTIKLDMETLNMYYDAEMMGAVLDAEKLGGDEIFLDKENLGTIIFDAEELGVIADVDKLGVFDAEKLGTIRNMEILGVLRPQ